MASVSVNINAQDHMSPVIANLQQQLNQLQQSANINIGANARNAQNTINYTTRLFESMLNNLGNRIWNTFTMNLRAAYNEIKAIDDELVVVRRVTGKTNAELAGMATNANKVAQTYGIAASKYLEGVANFTRAGYGDQAEGLAELSVKLQRAGDVSSDVANAYMTAVDKAYGFQGSVESLTAAMDGANQIGNEYATNVGEIAAGIGKVASIAATGHVGIDELTAALGTITAVTQRSGTEAATALRAIFLNIMGDTTTEIEEGAKWTAGEIEGLSDVLKIYAPEVVAAAEATGSLIDPMVAIGALAKSYQKGVLTEAKLFSMVNDIGGKLRTNQLMVLIKNWDMYQSMLKTYANASGSIDREVQNSLDSITVKTERLKASWVALVNNTVSTGMIKGFLDGLNTAVQSMGNLGNVLAIVLGLVTALKAQRIATLFAGIGGGRSAAWITAATNGIRSWSLAIAGIGVALSVVNGIVQAHNNAVKEQANSAISAASSASTASSEIITLYGNLLSAKTGTEEYTTALIALAEALGITAVEAQAAGSSIHELTLEKLKSLAAEAKSAMEQYEKAMNGGLFTSESYYVPLTGNWAKDGKDFNEEMMAFVKSSEKLSKYYKEGEIFGMPTGASELSFLKTQGNLLELIDTYEAVLDLKKKLDQYALDNDLVMLEYEGYNSLVAYLNAAKENYDGAKAAVDSFTSSMVDMYEATIPARQQMLLVTEDTSAETLSEYAKQLETIIDSVSAGAYTDIIKKALVKRFKQLFPEIMDYSDQLKDLLDTDDSGTKEAVDGTADAVDRLATALSTATKAKNAFDAAMARDAENKGFTDYQSAYTAYAEEIEAGRVNSRRAMAAAEYLMAGSGWNFAEIYGTEGYAGVNAAMKKGPWATVYGDAERTYGEGFVELLGRIANKNGEIALSSGEVVATYKDVNGQIQFTVSNFKGLSEATGLQLDQIWQSMKAVGVYGTVAAEEVNAFTNSLKGMGESAGIQSNEAGQLVVDYEQFRNAMMEGGVGEQDWMAMKQWLYFLNEIGEIEMAKVPNVEGGWEEYADWVSDAADRTAEAAEEAKKASADGKDALKEAKQLAAESTPEALGLPVDASQYDLSKVTEQTAAMNLVLDQMRENVGDDKTGSFLTQMQESARALGGDLEIVEGKITSITDANGEAADWSFLADVIEGTGEATALLTAFGVDIQGLFDTDYEIRFTVDPDNEAGAKLTNLAMLADGVSVKRTINYNANGTIANIDIIERDANDAASDRVVGFYAGDKLQNATKIEKEADGTAHARTIEFTTKGTVAHIEAVTVTADNAAIARHIDFDTDGNVENLTITEGKLTDAQQDRAVLFTADPSDLNRQLPTISGNANAVIEKVKEFKYGANGELLEAQVTEIEKISETETLKNTYYFKFGANGDALTGSLAVIKTSNDGAVNEKTYEFKFGANSDGVNAGVKTAEETIRGSTGGVIDDYVLGADASGVEDGTDAAETDIKTSLETTDGEYTLTANTDGLIRALREAGQAITIWKRDPMFFLGSGIPEGTPQYASDPKPLSQLLGWIPSVEVEVEPDVDSATAAAEETADIVQLKLQEAQIPIVPSVTSYDSTAVTEDGNSVYTVTYELEDQDGVFDSIKEVNQQDGSTHTITIRTAGDGAQTISETYYDVDSMTEKTHTVTINADGTVETDLENIYDVIDLLQNSVEIGIYADTQGALSRLNVLKNKLDQIKSKTITVTAITKSKNSNTDSIDKNAKGTDSFRGGLSLINEEGPELVAANGSATFYGGGKPTIAPIPRGATIFTAEETAALLAGRTSLPAYAEGQNTDAIQALLDAMKGATTDTKTTTIPKATGGNVQALVTIPEKEKEEEKKEEDKSRSSSSSGSQSSDDEEEEEDEFWNTITEYIDYGLKKIQYQIDGYQDDITAIERARDALIKPIQNELDDLDYSLQLLQYEVKLLERARDDAIDPLDEEIERLKKARDITKEDEALEEKKLAVEEARANLEEAQHQRTVRYFNEETGQWEWMADQKAIQDAQEALEKAEEDYLDAQEEYEITLLERERDAIEEDYQRRIDELEGREEEMERRQEDLDMEKTKIEHEYGESIEPLQDQLDSLQTVYDDLQKYYNRLVDAVEVPMDSLTDALKEMESAAENYTAQLDSTIKLLDTLYEIAPTWKAIEVGDLGGYTASKSTYGDYNVDQSTTVNIDGVTIEGKDAETLAQIVRRRKMYTQK